MANRAVSSFCLTTCLVVWLAGLAYGFAQLANYGAEAGNRGELALTMPVTDQIKLSTEKPTLVMFIHPKCPCTRASLGELNELLARYGTQLSCYLVFVRPGDMPEEWVKSDLWKQADTFPGVELIIDHDRVLARQFGARTSGETMLYYPNGCLVFGGGITYSRGHSGDNLGIHQIITSLKSAPEQLLQTPVFGCPLFSKAEEDQAKCCAT